MFNKKTIIEVDYEDLNRFIEAALGVEYYSLVEVEECSNDSILRFLVTGEPVGDYGLAKIQAARDGDPVMYSTGYILDYLCADGHLEPGEYYVRVSW